MVYNTLVTTAGIGMVISLPFILRFARKRFSSSTNVLLILIAFMLFVCLYVIGQSQWNRQLQITGYFNHADFIKSFAPQDEEKDVHFELIQLNNHRQLYEFKASRTPFLWLPTYKISRITEVIETEPALDTALQMVMSNVSDPAYTIPIEKSEITYDVNNLYLAFNIQVGEAITLSEGEELINTWLEQLTEIVGQDVQTLLKPYQVTVHISQFKDNQVQSLFSGHKRMNDTILDWSFNERGPERPA